MAGKTVLLGIKTTIEGLPAVQRGLEALRNQGDKLGVNWTKLGTAGRVVTSGLQSMTADASRLGRGLLSLAGVAGALSIGGFALMASRVFDLGEELFKTSKITGISTDALQEFRYAAGLSSVDTGTLTAAFRFLNRNVVEAAQNVKGPAAQAFNRLGIEIKDTSGHLKTSDVLFTEVADRVSKLGTEAEKTNVLMDLFGRSGAALLPMFAEGAVGINKLRDEARKLGIVIDADLIEKAEAAGDVLSKFKTVAENVGTRLLIAFAPAIASLNDKFVELAPRIGEVASALGGQLADGAIKVVEFMLKLGENFDLVRRVAILFIALKIGSYFGPWGALIGFVSGALIILADKLMEVKTASEQSKVATEEYSKALGSQSDAAVVAAMAENRLAREMTQRAITQKLQLIDQLQRSNRTAYRVDGQRQKLGELMRTMRDLEAQNEDLISVQAGLQRQTAEATAAIATAGTEASVSGGKFKTLSGFTMDQVRSAANLANVNIVMEGRLRKTNEATEKATALSKENAKTEEERGKRIEKVQLQLIRGERQTSYEIMMTARAHNIAATAEKIRTDTGLRLTEDRVHAAGRERQWIMKIEEANKSLARTTERDLGAAFKSAGEAAREMFNDYLNTGRQVTTFTQGLVGSLRDGLVDVFEDGKFSSTRFFDNLKRLGAELLAERTVGIIGEWLFGKTGSGGGSSGGGDIFGGIFDAIGNLFGGGGGGGISGGSGSDTLSGGAGTDTLGGLFGGGAGGGGGLGALGGLLSLGGMLTGNSALTFGGMGLGVLDKLPGILDMLGGLGGGAGGAGGGIFSGLGNLLGFGGGSGGGIFSGLGNLFGFGGGGGTLLGGGGGATLGGLGGGTGIMGLLGPGAIFGALAFLLPKLVGEETTRMGGSAGFKWDAKKGYGGSTLAASWSGVNGAALKRYADVVGKTLDAMEDKGLIDVKKLGGFVSLVINEDTNTSALGFSTKPMKSIIGNDLKSFIPLKTTKDLLNAVLAYNVQAGNIVKGAKGKDGALEKFIKGLKGQGLSTLLATLSSNSRTAVRLPNGEINFIGSHPGSDNFKPGGASNIDAIADLVGDNGNPAAMGVRKFATQGRMIATRPTFIVAGEDAAEEVSVRRVGAGGGGGNKTVVIEGPLFLNDLSIDRLARQLTKAMDQGDRRRYGGG